MTEIVGALGIELILLRDGFNRGLQALQSLKGGQVALQAVLDTRLLRQQINNLSQLKPTIQAQVAITNLNQVEGQLKTLTRDRRIRVGIEFDDRGIEQKLQRYTNRSFKVTAQVDDRQLTALNKHLDLKARHFSQVNNLFKSSPLTPRVDFSNLDKLDQRLSGLQGKTIDVVANVVYSSDSTPRSISQTVTQSFKPDTGDFEKSISKSIERSFKQVKGGSLLSGLGSVITAPLKLAGGIAAGAAGSIGSSLLFGITQPISQNLGKGLSTALEKSLSNSVGSSELLGEKVGGAIGSAIANGASSRLQSLSKVIEAQIEKIEDKGTRQKVQERFEQVRSAPAKAKQAITQTIGEDEILREGLFQRGSREQSRAPRASVAREQAATEFRSALEQSERVEQRATVRISKVDQQIAAQRQTIAQLQQQYKQLEQKISAAQAQGATPQEIEGGAAKLADTARNLQAETNRLELLGKQRSLASSALDQAKQQRITARSRLDAVAPPEPPKAFTDLARVALGDKFSAENLPKLQVSDATLKKLGAEASYNAARNTIRVTEETFKAIKSNTLTAQQQETLLEELNHAVDFDFGSFEGIKARKENRIVGQAVTPTPEEFASLAGEVGLYAPEQRGFELNAKVKAKRNLKTFQDQQQQAQRLETSTTFASASIAVQQRGTQLEQTIQNLETVAAKTGTDVSKATATLRSVFQGIKQDVDAVAQEAIQNANSLTAESTAELTARITSAGNKLSTLEEAAQNRLAKEINLREEQVKAEAPQPLQIPLKPLKIQEPELVEIGQRSEAQALALRQNQPPQPSFRERVGSVAEGAGKVARSVADGAQKTASVVKQVGEKLQAPAAALIQGVGIAAKGTFAIGKAGYKLAEAVEGVVLDIVPLGRGAKAVGKNIALPALAFGAASTLVPGVAPAIGAATQITSSALAPFASAASTSAGSAIGGLLPNVFGLQGAVTGAATGALDLAFAGASVVLAKTGVAVVGGRTVATVAGRTARVVTDVISNAVSGASEQIDGAKVKVATAKSRAKNRGAIEVEASAVVEPPPKKLVIPKSTSRLDTAIAAAENIEQQFASAYQNLKLALKEKDARLVNAYKQTLLKQAVEGKRDIDALISELKANGENPGAINKLGGVKGRLSQKENLVTRSTAKFEQEQRARGEDLSAQSLASGAFSPLDAALDQFKRSTARALKSINEATASFAEVEKQQTLGATLKAATKSPKVQAIAKDLAVNTAGFAASQLAGQQGQVAGLGGDLIGALAARQAINAGIPYAQAILKLKKSEEFLKAGIKEKARLLQQAAAQFQVEQGEELFGDLTGFTIGNGFATAANAGLDALSGTVPGAGLLRAIPFKGAAVASAAVPQLAKLRERVTGQLSADRDARARGEDLSAQSLNGKQIVSTLNSKRRKLLEQLEQQLGNTIDSVSLLLKGQPDLINNAKVTRVLTRLNQQAQRLLDERVERVDEVFEAETEKFNAQLQAINTRVQTRLKSQPDFGLVVDRGVANQVQAEGQKTIAQNAREIKKNQRLAFEQEGKGLGFVDAPAQIIDAPASQFGKGAIGSVRKFFAELNDDLSVGVAKRTQKLLTESKILVSDIETGRIAAQGRGDTAQAKKLGTAGKRAQGAISEAESILGQSNISGKDRARLQSLGGELRGTFKLLDRPVPADPGGFAGIGEKALGLVGKLKLLGGAFLGVTIATQAVQVLKQFATESVNAAIKLDNLKTALSFGSGGAGNAAKDLAFIRGEATRLGVPLGALQDGFVKLSASTKGTSNAGQVTKDLVTGLAQASTTLGLSAEESGGAILALSQIASKGTVQAEELRGQLGERIPGAFSIAARAMGVTEGQLNKLLETGSVTANEFLPKFARQLQVEFAGSAQSAATNVQSSLFKLGNAFQQLQENSGKLALPAVAVGANVLTGAIGLLANNVDKLLLLATALAFRFSGLGKVDLGGLLGQVKGLASGLDLKTTFAKGGAGRAALGQAGGVAAQAALLAGVVETGRAIGEVFSLSEKGKQFKEFGDQGETNLKRIEDAAKRARGEIENIPSKPGKSTSKGFDFTLGLASATGLDQAGLSLKSDDLIKASNSNPITSYITGAAFQDQIAAASSKLTGGRFEFRPGTTVEELQQQREALQFDRFRDGNRNLTQQVLSNQNADANSLVAAKGLDKEIQSLQNRKNRLSATPNADKGELKAIDEQIQAKQVERKKVSDPLVEKQAGITAQINNVKSALSSDGLSPEQKAGLESDLKGLLDAQASFDRLQAKLGITVDKTRDLSNAFAEMASKLEEVKRQSDNAFNKGLTQDLTQQLAQFGSNANASIDTPVQSARRELDKANAEFEGNKKVLDDLAQKLKDPEVLDKLSSVRIGATGRAVTPDSTIAELELAKKSLSDSDPTKAIIDNLINYKKAQDQQTSLEKDGAQARIALKKAEEQAKLAEIQKAEAQRESEIKRNANTAQTGLLQRQAKGNEFESDIQVDSAKQTLSKGQAELNSTKQQLDEIESAYAAGTISAEEYEKQRREIGDRISDQEVQNAQNEVALVKATEAAKLSEIDRAARQREAQIKQQESRATVGLVSDKTRKLVSDDEFSIAQARNSLTTDNAQQSNVQAQIDELDAAFARGIVKREEYEKRSQDLANSLADLNVKKAQDELAIREAIDKKILESRKRLITGAGLDQGLLGNQGQAALIGVDIGESQKRLSAQSAELGNLQQQLQASSAPVEGDIFAQIGAGDRVAKAKEIEERINRITASSVEERTKKRELELQRDLKLIAARGEAEEREIDRKKSALDSELKLSQAIADSRQSQLKIGIDRNGESVDAFKQLQNKSAGYQLSKVLKDQLTEAGFNTSNTQQGVIDALQNKQALEAEADREKVAALLQQQALERESVKLGLQKEQISARTALNEAKRAELLAKQNLAEAQGGLAKARRSGNVDEIQSAQEQVKFAQEGVGLASEGVGLATLNARTIDDKVQKELAASDFRQAQQRSELDAQNQLGKRARDRELASTADDVKFTGQLNFSGFAASAALQAPQTTDLPPIIPTVTPNTNQVDRTVNTAASTTNNSDVVAKLEQLYNGIIELANKPRSLTFNTAQPVDDYAKFMNDAAGQSLRSN
jgi:tape measure domain-containing protein